MERKSRSRSRKRERSPTQSSANGKRAASRSRSRGRNQSSWSSWKESKDGKDVKEESSNSWNDWNKSSWSWRKEKSGTSDWDWNNTKRKRYNGWNQSSSSWVKEEPRTKEDKDTKEEESSGWNSSSWRVKEEPRTKEDKDTKEEESNGWNRNSWRVKEEPRTKEDKDTKEEESSGWNRSSWRVKEEPGTKGDKDTKEEEESSGWNRNSWRVKEEPGTKEDKDTKEEESSGWNRNSWSWRKETGTNSWGGSDGWAKSSSSWVKDPEKKEDKAESNGWNNYSSWDDDKNDWWAQRYFSEADRLYQTVEHGSKEWMDHLNDGDQGLKYEPGDEILTRVLPRDFKYFDEDACSTWKNKPAVLVSTDSFWVFGKSVNWVCSNTSSRELRLFKPRGYGTADMIRGNDGDRGLFVDGSLPAYVVSTYGKEYPFVCENTEVFHVPSLEQNNLEKSGFGMLHRLDRETSGPVLVAKTKEGFKRLKNERDNHNWHKEYITLCHGKIPADKFKGVINIPLRRKKNGPSSSFSVDACHRCREHYEQDGDIRPRGKCRKLDKEGYACLGESKSYYNVVKYYQHTNKLGVTYDYTFVRIKLVSGKTHQIRVHMRLFGERLKLPVYGVASDFKYLKDNFPDAYHSDCQELCQRVFLHSVVLGFRDPDDPFTNRVAEFNLQNDLMSTMAKLKCYDEAEKDLYKYQKEAERDTLYRFAQDFGLNADAENAVKASRVSDELVKLFYKCCEHPDKTPAARSFNGDHSAMIMRVLKDYADDVDSLDVLVEREFPEKLKRDDDTTLQLPPGWERKSSRNIPGAFYYHNRTLNIVQIEHPARAEMEGLPPGWKKVESKSKPGKFYFYNTSTSTSHMELPEELRDYKAPAAKSSTAQEAESSTSKIHLQWVRRESTRQPGCFYWFNAVLNKSSPWHPLGHEPLPQGWVREESSSVKGKYYFKNVQTQESSMEHPVTKKKWSDTDEWTFHVSTSNKNVCYWAHKTTAQTTFIHPVTGINVAG